MNKTTIFSLFLLFISFLGCDDNPYFDDVESNYFGFITSEIVVNVTPETKSYRIEVEWTHEVNNYPTINIDRENTTAKHNLHFVNTPEGGSYIGEFTPLLEEEIIYKDVKIMPENITEKVVIVYKMSSLYIDGKSEPEGLIKELKVVLQPKVQ